VIRPTQVVHFGPVRPYLLTTTRVCSNRISRLGTTMFALITFGVVILLLAAGLGLPYPQTWHGRWGNYYR